jgi:hypothetical protein
MTVREFEPMPEGMFFYNGSGTPCDMLVGPCSCGATHSAVDWAQRVFAERAEERERCAKVCDQYAAALYPFQDEGGAAAAHIAARIRSGGQP